MLSIPKNIQSDIDAIIYYYNRKSYINRLKDVLSKDKLDKIKKDLENEMHSKYEDSYEFVNVDGRYTTQIKRKKIGEGRLENVKQFLNSRTEKSAINRYLKSKGYKIDRFGEMKDDSLYGVRLIKVNDFTD